MVFNQVGNTSTNEPVTRPNGLEKRKKVDKDVRNFSQSDFLPRKTQWMGILVT